MVELLLNVVDPLPSDSQQFGGLWGNRINDILKTGQDFSSDEDLNIGTEFKFHSGSISIYENDPIVNSDRANAHRVQIRVENITTGALLQTLTIRAPTVDNDFFMTELGQADVQNKIFGSNIQFTEDIDFNGSELLDAVINGSNTTITNIPNSSLLQITDKGKQHTQTVYLDENNVFTAIQKIAVDNGQQITFYRPVNNAGFGAGFYYDFDDSLDIEHTYGFQYVSIEDNIEATLRGDFNVQLAINNALGLRFRVFTSGDGGIIIGNNQRMLFSETGLTAQRAYTGPDEDTRLLGLSDIENYDRDTTREKRGRYECNSKWKLDTTGIFKDMKYVGNFSASQDGAGTNQVFQTGGLGTNSWAGHYIFQVVGSFAGWTRPSALPRTIFREFIPNRSSGDLRFLHGFYTGVAFPPAADGNPLDVNNGGIIIGFDSDDTNFQIWIGSGDGVTAVSTPIDTGVAVPTASGINRVLDINFTMPNSVTIKILDGNTITELYSTTITTNLPAGTKSLNFINLINNPTNANKSLTCYGAWGKMSK